MKIKELIDGSALRIVLSILAALTIGSFITFSIAEGLNNKQRLRQINFKRIAFEEMLQSLEFKGLDGETKKRISDYVMQSDESMNVIITNDLGKVLFHLNDGFLTEPEFFVVVVNPREPRPYQAFIIDSKNSVRYQVRLNQGYNSFKLVEMSADNDATRMLFPDEADQVSPKKQKLLGESRFRSLEINEGNSMIIIKDRFFGNDLSNIMNYAYIGSKSWHVYSIYKDNGAYDYNSPNALDRLVKYLKPLALGTFFLFWFLLPLWVFHDARKREFKAPLWGILVLVTNIAGLIIYLVVRPELVVCKQCGAHLNSKYVSCPICGAQNRERCAACQQIIEKNWVACPYCGQLKSVMNMNSNLTNL